MDLGMKKGDKVVKVITITGIESATIQTVRSVTRDIVKLVGSELKYDTNGREIDVAPGFAAAGIGSRLIPLEK